MKTIPEKPTRLDRKSLFQQKLYRLLNSLSFIPSSQKYNLTISDKNKFVWFRVAKVGTRTIYNHLRSCNVELDVDHAYNIYYPSKLYHDYFKFAFVRNPWDRLASGWLNKIVYSNAFHFSEDKHNALKKLDTFVEFLAHDKKMQLNNHFCQQSSLIDLNNIDYLGRIESFDADMNIILERLNIRRNQISPRNVTQNRKPYREYYDSDLAEKVAQMYRKDIQLFGYKY